MTDPNMDALLTLHEISVELGVDIGTVRKYVKAEVIPPTSVFRMAGRKILKIRRRDAYRYFLPSLADLEGRE